jgi:hypothetical protein
MTFQQRLSNRLFGQLVIAEYCTVFFSISGLFLNIIQHEMQHNDKTEFIVITVGLFDIMCTCCLIPSIYIRYDLLLKWGRTVNNYTSFDTLKNTGLWKKIGAEMCICLVAPYSFLYGIVFEEYVVEYDTIIKYELNDYLMVVMFARIYLLVRFSFYMTEFLNPRSQRVCNIYGFDLDAIFALKAVVKEMPATYLLCSLSTSILVFGYTLRIFEAPLTEVSA